MNNDNSRRKLGKEDDSIDRLSYLPEHIIWHILSFLDTKTAVQTSVLARAWRCAWKHVSSLDLRSCHFERYSSFERYVDKVLSLRYGVNVGSMRYIDGGKDWRDYINGGWVEPDVSMHVKVVKYALSHDAEHFEFRLHDMDMDMSDSSRFSILFGTISSCNLKSLVLMGVCIDRGFGSSGFGMLTTLKLAYVPLASDQDGEFDPFSSFPCLKNLVMIHCLHLEPDDGRLLKISGSQLLSLELDNVWSDKIEIFAPRLKFLELDDELRTLVLSKLNCPSLDHAVIRIQGDDKYLEENEERVKCLISLFRGLNNVISLTLDSDGIEVLSDISDFLERQPSPFTRLKSLIVKADRLPYNLVDYFFKGSSSTNPTVEFVKPIG